MHESKTHFEQIPVEIVKKIATNLPSQEFPEENGGNAVDVETQDNLMSPTERWRAVAQEVQREADPARMIELVQQLIATLDEEQAHQRMPHRRDAQKRSRDLRRGPS